MRLTFSTSDVTRAAEVPNATFQTWMRRGHLLVQPDDMAGGEGSGNHRRFSLGALVQVALAAELMKLGLSPDVAFRAAARFAFRGNHDDEALTRFAGYPFHWEKGETLLIVPDGQGEMADAVLVKQGTLPLWDVPLVNHQPAKGFIAINAGRVFERALTNIGYDPVQLVNEAYGWHKQVEAD